MYTLNRKLGNVNGMWYSSVIIGAVYIVEDVLPRFIIKGMQNIILERAHRMVGFYL